MDILADSDEGGQSPPPPPAGGKSGAAAAAVDDVVVVMGASDTAEPAAKPEKEVQLGIGSKIVGKFKDAKGAATNPKGTVVDSHPYMRMGNKFGHKYGIKWIDGLTLPAQADRLIANIG